MKIKETEIKELSTILEKLYTDEVYAEDEKNRGSLFFPIEEVGEEKDETDEGVILLNEFNKNRGSKTLIRPGLLLSDTGVVRLAYVSTEYAYEFNIKKYSSVMKNIGRLSINKKEIEKVSAYECLLVRKEQIIISF